MVGSSPSRPILSRVEPLQLIVLLALQSVSAYVSSAQLCSTFSKHSTKAPSFLSSASNMVLEPHCQRTPPTALFCPGEANSLLYCPAPAFPCSRSHFCILIGQADKNHQSKKRFSAAPGLAEVKHSSCKDMVLSNSMGMHLMARLLYDSVIIMASIIEVYTSITITLPSSGGYYTVFQWRNQGSGYLFDFTLCSTAS